MRQIIEICTLNFFRIHISLKKISSSKLQFINQYGELNNIIEACDTSLYGEDINEVDNKYCGNGKQTNYAQFITKENEYLKNITKSINLYSGYTDRVNDTNDGSEYVVNYKGFNKIICECTRNW